MSNELKTAGCQPTKALHGISEACTACSDFALVVHLTRGVSFFLIDVSGFLLRLEVVMCLHLFCTVEHIDEECFVR